MPRHGRPALHAPTVLHRTLAVIRLTQRELSPASRAAIAELRATVAAPPPLTLAGL